MTDQHYQPAQHVNIFLRLLFFSLLLPFPTYQPGLIMLKIVVAAVLFSGVHAEIGVRHGGTSFNGASYTPKTSEPKEIMYVSFKLHFILSPIRINAIYFYKTEHGQYQCSVSHCFSSLLVRNVLITCWYEMCGSRMEQHLRGKLKSLIYKPSSRRENRYES